MKFWQREQTKKTRKTHTKIETLISTASNGRAAEPSNIKLNIVMASKELSQNVISSVLMLLRGPLIVLELVSGSGALKFRYGNNHIQRNQLKYTFIGATLQQQ